MQKVTSGILFIAITFFCTGLHAQVNENDSIKKYKVGIFAPVYLDSVFKGNNYKYQDNFPRFTFQGLDFIHGAMIALDSLAFPNARIETYIYDTNLSLDLLGIMISACWPILPGRNIFHSYQPLIPMTVALRQTRSSPSPIQP